MTAEQCIELEPLGRLMTLGLKYCRKHRIAQANETIAAKLVASLSKRVTMRRFSLGRIEKTEIFVR